MSYQLWSQDVFSKGELSPFMYGRATVNEYGNGLKTAQNVLTYPTGAAGKRFGTLYQSTLKFTNPQGLYFETFQYLNECVYQLVIYKSNIDIYLEGIFIANVSNSLSDFQVANLSTTTLNTTFRMAGTGFQPLDLTRSTNVTTYPITGFNSNSLVMATGNFSVGIPLPVQFTGVTLPTSNPQIIKGVTYFMMPVNATTVMIYSNATDAKFNTPGTAYTFSNFGNTAVMSVLNTWTLANTVFKNLPFFDFNGDAFSYDALTFTPSAVTGAAVTITVSGAGYSKLDSSYVGGAFFGNGGSSRITAVASATSFTVAVSMPFRDTTAILGSLAVLAEPAWSTARGFPKLCSSYQNRALFANSTSLPNGFWASAINAYSDFGDLTNDDDDAISWYPSSNNVNYIRFIVPYRSITIHTNTGIYSSPLSEVAAITPSNFTLQLQDSTPADVLQPQAIDNQVLVLAGNDAHQMLWDGINNAYTSDIVSVISEQTIRNPVDETPYADLRRAGSRYVFIINADGSMAVFQTLISQNVSGFTPQILEQPYGEASFLQAASSNDGRAWFVNERNIASPGSTINITGFAAATPTSPSTLHAINTGFPTLAEGGPIAILFTTTGSLPATVPALQVNQYYWAVGVNSNDFIVYNSQADALSNSNPISFTSAGVNSTVNGWAFSNIFTLEELTQDTFLDCAVFFNNGLTPQTTINTGNLFNAQSIKMIGDGFGFDAVGVNNQVTFEAHGVPVAVSEGYIGFPINTIIEPMPLTMANGPSAKQTTLTKPKHVRSVRFMFNNTIGGTITTSGGNAVPIALEPFDMANIGNPPQPARGIMEMMTMSGWDDFNNPTYTITHSDPFNIQLLGVYYSVEI